MLKKIEISHNGQKVTGTLRDVEVGAKRVQTELGREVDKLKAKHAQLQAEADGLLIKLIKSSITQEDYRQKYGELTKQRNEALEKIAEFDTAADNHCELVIRLLERFSGSGN